VICNKCNQSKDDNIAPTCQCGGSYKTSMNRAELKTKLKMIQSGMLPILMKSSRKAGLILVCGYHELAMAGEYVGQVLDRW